MNIFTRRCTHANLICDSLQGAPGNRGFPGQDGLAGAKVGPT